METEIRIFPIGQFFITGFSSSFCFNSDRNDGGILLYTREDIPSKVLSMENKIETVSAKINLLKKQWLISCSHNLNKAIIANNMTVVSKNIDIYTTKQWRTWGEVGVRYNLEIYSILIRVAYNL